MAAGGSDTSRSEKEQLRRRMRALRRAIPEEERRRLAAQVEHRLVALPELRRAGTILLFYSFGSEIDTGGITRSLRETRKRLLLPFLRSGAMEAAEVGAEDELHPTRYGPKEPSLGVAVDPNEVDLVVTPGLAFDRRGHRLGYGGGHYDRYLARLGDAAMRIGIGFAAQVLAELPAEATDQPVDLVLTEDETIRVG